MSDLKDFCGWSFFVDTGGTFTDCLGLSPNMEWFRAKVLSRGSIPAEVLEQIDAKTLKISKTENSKGICGSWEALVCQSYLLSAFSFNFWSHTVIT